MLFYILYVETVLAHMVRRVWRFLLPADHAIGGHKSLSCHLVSMRLYFYYVPMHCTYSILFTFQIFLLTSFFDYLSFDVDCCAHKKSFNTAIPVRSLGPYMRVHYCTFFVHILATRDFLFLLTSWCDYVSFVWIVPPKNIHIPRILVAF